MANNFKNDEQRVRWNIYNKNYSKKNYKTITMKLNKEKDKDIIDFLTGQQESITDIVRKLVREKL